MLIYLLQLARQSCATAVEAEYVDNGKNRQMYLTYKFNGFFDIPPGSQTDGKAILRVRHDLSVIPPLPDYLRVVDADGG